MDARRVANWITGIICALIASMMLWVGVRSWPAVITGLMFGFMSGAMIWQEIFPSKDKNDQSMQGW